MCSECRAANIPMTFPGLAGCSSGPGSGANEAVFNRPDPLKECRLALKKTEEAGQLRDPRKMAMAEAKLKSLKAQEPHRQKKDYDKSGHPLEGLQG